MTGQTAAHPATETIVEGLVFPEGIRWAQGRVWFSDILGAKVYSCAEDGSDLTVVADLDDKPSGLGFMPDGSLLIATVLRRQLLHKGPNGLRVVADLSQHCDLLNDMVVDRLGRAYINAYSATGNGGLLLVEPDGAARFVARDLQVPNGMAITPDGHTLVMSEYGANRLLSFAIAADGSLSAPTVFADLVDRGPDGICLDPSGAVWAGCPESHCFLRIARGGEVLGEVRPAPGRLAVATALGGANGDTLFMCTSHADLGVLEEHFAGPIVRDIACHGWIERVSLA